MMQLPRYESYKDSGVEWLGEVPEEWNLWQGFKLFKENKNKNSGMIEDTVLSLSYGRVVIKPEEKLHGLVPESFEGYQLIEPSDTIIRTTDLQNDKTSLRCGYANDKGIITSAYLSLKPLGTANPKFTYYVLHAYDLLKVFYGMGSGLRQNLDFRDFKRMIIPIPESGVQERIVSFLDKKTAEIDEAIAKKKKLIELLQEQKSILINQAVTKGLNPDAPMKDSGVEWIGEIPAHWKPYRLKFTFNGIEQGWSPQCFNYVADDDVWGVLKVGCVNGFVFNQQNNKVLPPNLKPRLNLEIQHNDILISRANTLDLVGSAARVIKPRKKLILCDKLYRVRVSEQIILPDFFVFALQTRQSREQIQLGANGASDTMQNIGQDVIKNLWIPVPPVSEQTAILNKLNRNSQLVADTKVKFEKEIQALSEYKQSLISSAVTGKIKV